MSKGNFVVHPDKTNKIKWFEDINKKINPKLLKN